MVDLGCGTGLNFFFLQQKVGSSGRIIGVDLTDAMLNEGSEYLGQPNATKYKGRMDCPELKSVRQKIDRAQQHFNDIKSALKLVSGTGTEGQPVLINNDYERQQLIVTLPKITPLDPSFPLMIGDCIHSLRSALDHIVPQHPRYGDMENASGKAGENTETFSVLYSRFYPVLLDEAIIGLNQQKVVCQ